ncbi:MAG: nuclear transport factor 2 family protein [Gammaproteobacteria bacterium]|nr:nuclear transport factor 2 family protein [Gammaproteobacteria bacterium]
MSDTHVADGGIDADQAAMKAQLEGVIEAYNAADPEAFKSAYTEDAWVISMRRPIKASREEIGAAFTPGMSQYLFHTDLDVLDVEVHGDIAYMIGRSKLTGKPREGATVPAFVEERIYTAIFKRDGDEWLIHRHMESTSPIEGSDLPE